MSDVKIEVRVTQVEDGKVYTGNVRFDDVLFDYALDFRVPIAEMLGSAIRTEDMREYVSITASRGKTRIELTPDEADLFVATVVKCAKDFYRRETTRAAQEGITGYLLRNGLFSGELRVVDEIIYEITMPRTELLDDILRKRRAIPYVPAGHDYFSIPFIEFTDI